MTVRNSLIVAVMPLVMYITLPPCAWAEDYKQIELKESDLEASAASATVERICETAVNNIALRYNLNAEQKAWTEQLMKREVQKFLREHEEEVWPAIRDLLAAQLGAKPPDDKEKIKSIGKAALPIVKLAKEAIYKANEEWRTILTDDQKKMHDFDLAEMDKTFTQIEKNFRSWSEGTPTEAGLFPPPNPEVLARSPRQPKKPSPGLPEPPVVPIIRVHFFDAYVEDFIKEYRLNEGQVDTARSILREFKEKAEAFKDANKAEFTELAAAQQKAMEQRETERVEQIDRKRKELLQPLYALFAKMDQRLKGLLTSTQLAQYEARNSIGTDAATDKRTKKSDSKPEAKPADDEKSESKKAVPAEDKSSSSGGSTKTASKHGEPAGRATRRATDPSKNTLD